MGTGASMQAASYGSVRGQALAQLEYEAAEIPILKEKGEMELELQQKSFEQQLAQAEKMNLLSSKLSGGTQPVYVTPAVATAAATPAIPSWLILAGLAAAAYYLFFR